MPSRSRSSRSWTRTAWSPLGHGELPRAAREDVGLPAVDEDLVLALLEQAQPDLAAVFKVLMAKETSDSL
ncbi:MAG: hypothetical protein MZV65_53915 [Chromatiales bacterium]|nr:hypothetical protein [Chromatiales bacterium]